MELEILKIIKEEYLKRKKSKERIEKLLHRKEELEQNELVQEYLRLKGLLNDVKYKKRISLTDDEMIETSFRRHITKIHETNGIYVYLGTYMVSHVYDIVHGPSDCALDYNDPRAEYRIYHDIEKYSSIEVPINECSKFEKENKIIFPRTFFKGEYYYDLQKEFFKEAILNNQEEACTKVLKRVKE